MAMSHPQFIIVNLVLFLTLTLSLNSVTSNAGTPEPQDGNKMADPANPADAPRPLTPEEKQELVEGAKEIGLAPDQQQALVDFGNKMSSGTPITPEDMKIMKSKISPEQALKLQEWANENAPAPDPANPADNAPTPLTPEQRKEAENYAKEIGLSPEKQQAFVDLFDKSKSSGKPLTDEDFAGVFSPEEINKITAFLINKNNEMTSGEDAPAPLTPEEKQELVEASKEIGLAPDQQQVVVDYNNKMKSGTPVTPEDVEIFKSKISREQAKKIEELRNKKKEEVEQDPASAPTTP